ncbi:MAG: hypothetical protein ACRDRU_12065 [Pseudonocardiaceae bacterium]
MSPPENERRSENGNDHFQAPALSQPQRSACRNAPATWLPQLTSIVHSLTDESAPELDTTAASLESAVSLAEAFSGNGNRERHLTSALCSPRAAAATIRFALASERDSARAQSSQPEPSKPESSQPGARG